MHLSVPIYRLKRQARAQARAQGIPLHAALDAAARAEGYTAWSHLSAVHTNKRPGSQLLHSLSAGDRLLLAARPGHGKTLLALELLAEACRTGRTAAFFTLDEHAGGVADRLRDLGYAPADLTGLHVDTSDTLSAETIVAALHKADRGSVFAVDYLQILDQRRETPPLAQQIDTLSAFAQARGLIFVAISQIDRRFELSGRAMPGLGDIRLPNPLDMRAFNRRCFLHGGEIDMPDAA